LKNLVSAIVSTAIDITTVLPTDKITPYVFTKPFTSGEYNEGIKALQNLLTTIKLYS